MNTIVADGSCAEIETGTHKNHRGHTGVKLFFLFFVFCFNFITALAIEC